MSLSIRLFVSLFVLLFVLLDLASCMYNDDDACKKNYISKKIHVKDGLSGIITSPHFQQKCSEDVKMEIEFNGGEDDDGEDGEMEGEDEVRKGAAVKYRLQLDIFYLNLGYENDEEEERKMNNEQPNQCDSSDYIKVWVNVEDSKREIASLCYWNKGEKMMSSNHLMWMEFVRRSDSNSLGKAFNASYHFVTDFGIETGLQRNDKEKYHPDCMFEYKSESATNGTFVSPNYPGLYPRNTECFYLFKGKGERIIITFEDFNVEGTHNCEDGTQSDYVEFSNFNIGLVDRKMDRFCGSTLAKNEVQSDGNFFRVTFVSNNAYDATGFKAHYQFKTVEEQLPPMKVNRIKPKNDAAERPILFLSSSSFLLSILSFIHSF